MAIGWIGAGKVGFSLGKYLVDHGNSVSGYYSRNPESAREAAEFTGTRSYGRMEELVSDSDIIFLTVPDDVIGQVWEQIRHMQIAGKVICHCSGALSSKVFSDIAAQEACGYSVHPLLAVNDRLHSYRELSNALFTIEGEDSSACILTKIFQDCGNQVLFLAPEDKLRYHAAAVIASNLVLGLAEAAIEEFEQCGFSRETAKASLVPFMQLNLEHLAGQKMEECLTGPVERGDTRTVERHLCALTGENREIYRLLSRKIEGIARRKNPGRDYGQLDGLLK